MWFTRMLMIWICSSYGRTENHNHTWTIQSSFSSGTRQLAMSFFAAKYELTHNHFYSILALGVRSTLPLLKPLWLLNSINSMYVVWNINNMSQRWIFRKYFVKWGHLFSYSPFFHSLLNEPSLEWNSTVIPRCYLKLVFTIVIQSEKTVCVCACVWHENTNNQ